MHGFDWFRAATAWGGLRLVLVLESLLHSRVLTGREALLYAVSLLRKWQRLQEATVMDSLIFVPRLVG